MAVTHRRLRHTTWAIGVLLGGLQVPQALALDALGPHARSTHVTLPPGYFAGNEQGVQLAHDYGAFQLYRVDITHLNALRRSAADVLGIAKNTIDLPAQPLDPLAEPISVPDAYRRQGPVVETSLYLVQFVGPIVPEWLDQVRATGATPLQYLADNAYLVIGKPAAAGRLAALARSAPFMRYAADLEPYYKLAPELARRARQGHANDLIEITVIVADHESAAAGRQFVEQQGTPLGAWADLRDMQALTLRVAESKLPLLALRGDVISIEPYVAPRRLDEVQNQIIAGNLNPSQTGPSGPGYINWLTGLGFSTDPADYPIVSVVDDGVGNGLVANGAGDSTLTRNRDGTTTRLIFSKSCSAQAPHSAAGHGHINASIVGGFDNRAGFPFTDPTGYLRGVGVNPFTRLGNLKFFNDAGAAAYTTCGSNDQGMLRQQYTDGARISSNSWGGALNVYNASARAYDIGTRDASTTAGNQQMLFLFAAGNDGPGASTIGSPGTAKNVISVGASENRRPNDEDGAWLDGCGTPGPGADSAMDVIGFSSRGPVGTGRQKPDVIAPGTHVQGTASTHSGYVGDGVCDQYRPSAQTVFAASSGTSHSTPAVAGAASLVYRYLTVNHGPAVPSPAAVKAYLIAHPTFLTGTEAGANLPSVTQGFGMPNLGRAFSPTLRRIVVDQTTNLTATGQTYTLTGRIANRDEPLRITLAWTDAPGATSSTASLVNNLNLSVDHNGNTYRGNRFAGQWSTTGGSADTLNNVESVFLAPGADGSFTITVTAANLAGDGVPTTGTSTDQDFALVCSNCVSTNTFIVDASPTTRQVCAAAGASWSVDVAAVGGYTGAVSLSTASPAPGSSSLYTPLSGSVPFASTLAMNTSGVAAGGYLMSVSGTDGVQTASDPITLTVSSAAPLAAAGLSPANGTTHVLLSPTFSWSAVSGALGYLLEIDDNADFSSPLLSTTVFETSYTPSTNLNAGTRYFWRVTASNACGGTAAAAQEFTTALLQCQSFANNTTFTIGTAANARVDSPITSTLNGTVRDLNVTMRGTHSYIEDLGFYLFGPTISSVSPLFVGLCGNNTNFSLTLDDSAPGTPQGWPCAPAPMGQGGTYKPADPLAWTYNGIPAQGAWQLTVVDFAAGDGGSLTHFGLDLCVDQANSLVLAADDAYSTAEDTPLTVAAPGLAQNDSPAGLTLTVLSGPTQGSLTSFAGNGGFTYVPQADVCGSDSFTYSASNGSASDTATVRLQVSCVNDPPVAVADSYSTNQNTPLTVAAPGVLGNDSDPENSPLTAALVSSVSGGTLSLNPNGGFTYTPNTGFSGPDSFTYRANDGSLNSNTVTVSLMVNAVNQAPVAVADSYSAAEDTPLTVAAPGVLGNDSDPESTALTAVLVSGVSNGTLSLNANGGFIYTPNANYHGPDSFTYKANDGSLDSNTVTVSLTVMPVNDTPVAVADSYSTAEDTPLTVAAPGVLGNDSDVENQALTAILVSSVSNGTLSLNPNGGFTYTPNAHYHGPDSFTYKANDGALDSNTVTVSLTVTPVNDAPVAVADSYSANQNTPLTVAAPGVLGNDTDVENQALTAVLVTGVSHGTLNLNANGGFTYTPNTNYNGPDSFTYRANDGALDSNTVTVSLTVNAVNQAPVAVVDSYSTAEDTPLTVAAPGVLGNDTDVENQTLTAILVSSVSNGTLSLNPNGGFTYTPSANYHGPDSFTYKANDGALDSNTVTVSLTVTPVNDAPVAVADSYSTAEDTPLTVAAPGVLDNDTDVENQTLTAILVSSVSNGTLSLNPNGGFTYTPSANYHGPDSFTYKANDGALDSNTVTVSLTVTPVNDAPAFTHEPYAFSVAENAAAATAVGTLTAVDVDAGQSLAYTITGGNTGGAFTVNATTGAITVATPAAVTLASSPFTLTVGVRDNGVPQLTDTSTVTITVQDVNTAPAVTSLPNTVITATFPATIATAAAFTDPDGDTLSFGATGLPAALSIASGTGVITGNPPLAQIGSYTVTVRATDPGSLFAETTFTLRVEQDGLFVNGFEDAR